MKALLTFVLAVPLFMAGCDQDSTKPTATTNTANTATSPLNAPAGYLGALQKGQEAAVKTVDTTSIDKAIQMFSVENGRNPKDLNELVEQKYLPRIPEPPYGTRLVYDASSGTVKIVKQ